MIGSRPFGELPDGRGVTAYQLGAPGGPQVTVLDLGATIQSADPGDGFGGIVLGYDDVQGYLSAENGYQGALVGRYANRIAGGRFTLDGTTHVLDANEGATCLHGGRDGFHRRLWSVTSHDAATLTLRLISPDRDQGFPGTLTVEVTYTVAPGSLTTNIQATTDRPTAVSLTNHSYFNLGAAAGTIDDHLLTVDADHYLPVGDHAIPTGRYEPVDGTPFDLRRGALLGERVRASHEQLRRAGGLDHAFALAGVGMRRAARLEHPLTGRFIEVDTDQPSLQVYTGNALDGTCVGHGGRSLRQGDGVALETQRYPDGPNQPHLGEAFLRPGQRYRARTRWRFGQYAQPVTAPSTTVV